MLRKYCRLHTAPLTILNDNVDVLRARSSGGGVRDTMSSLSRIALGPRSSSGDGLGRGRMDPFRGGGDSTVICCGERSGGGGRDRLYEVRAGDTGGSGNEYCNSTGEPSASSSNSAAPSPTLGGAVATGVSPSRWRKSASGAMCAIRSPIGVGGMAVGISSAGSAGGMNVAIAGGGGVERPEGALRMRRRCLSDGERGTVGSGADIGVGTAVGGGGRGHVGGGLGGTSSAGGMT
jgi:hypothetical protein